MKNKKLKINIALDQSLLIKQNLIIFIQFSKITFNNFFFFNKFSVVSKIKFQK